MPGSDGIEVIGPHGDRYDEILTPDALALVARLQRELSPRRAELLAARDRRQEALSAGGTLEFLAGTQAIRDDGSWRVAPPAPGLVDRRVEITGPTDRKMTINALNSGAKVWLADFEDANTPLWDNMVTGQLNLISALDRTLDFTSEEGNETFSRMRKHLAENGVDLSKTQLQVGRTLSFDPKTEKFVNDAEADKLLTREYRKPFVVPENP